MKLSSGQNERREDKFWYFKTAYIEGSKTIKQFFSADKDNSKNYPWVHERHHTILYASGLQLYSLFREYRDYNTNGQIDRTLYLSWLQKFKALLDDPNLYTVDSLNYDEIKNEIAKYLIAEII